MQSLNRGKIINIKMKNNYLLPLNVKHVTGLIYLNITSSK